jgi:hypothetical protein
MPSLRALLVSGAMMASGAGVFAGVEHIRAASVEHPPPSQSSLQIAEAVPALPRPVVVVADPAIADRIAGIEAKLDKLASQPARSEPRDDADALIATPEHRTAEEQRGLDEASRTVDAALGRGSWLDGDQSRLQAASAEMLPADRFALRAKLANAANEGKLKDLAARPFFF